MIRRLLEQDLKTHGILNGGSESANTIRITLSEDLRERLWVAEVVQGSERVWRWCMSILNDRSNRLSKIERSFEKSGTSVGLN